MKLLLGIFGIVCLAVCLGLTCSNECSRKLGAKEYKELVKIQESGNSRLIRTFTDYSIDKQIDIYLYASACPNDPRFEPILARDGEKIIPDLVRRAEKEEKLWDKVNLVNVLIRINEQCKCIKSDSSVITALESVGRNLDNNQNIPDDNTYKKMYEDKIEFLKHQTNDN